MDMRSSNSAGCAESYSPLDKSKSQIRLLTLIMRRNQPNGTIQLHASTETFSFDSGVIPDYLALSYEWNPPNLPSTTDVLIMNGKEKSVSTNLYHALVCLFKITVFKTRFWVDALCINQEDTAERNHQVQLTRKIYGEALSVFVWLGNEWTVGARQSAASLLTEYQTRASEEHAVHGTSSHLRADENYKDHWQVIDSLFSQSYWNRSWIIQELVAAKVTLLLLVEKDTDTFESIYLDKFMMFLAAPLKGLSSYDRSINWAVVRSSTENIDEKTIGRRISAHQAVEGISVTKRRFPSHNDLLSLLARFCGQLATDPRDKVYSLLGIEEPNSDNSIRVDYSLKWTEVFHDAAIHVIQDRNDLEVLAYAGSSVTELPSWVPDWLDQERQGTMRFPHDKFCLDGRCCSPHTAQTVLRAHRPGRRPPSISADGSLLTISAGLFNIQSCTKVDSSDGELWAPLGELGDMMFSTWRANLTILDDSNPEFPFMEIFANFSCIWWCAIFHFYFGALEILDPLTFCNYIASHGQQTLTERQRELLRRALDEQLPFLTEVTPSVGSAIFTSNIFFIEGSETLAKRILDRQATVYIPGMCFWSSECGTLGPNHVLASIPLCRFPIILSKPEGSGTGYKVTTSARVANWEHGQIEQKDGTFFEHPVQEIDLA